MYCMAPKRNGLRISDYSCRARFLFLPSSSLVRFLDEVFDLLLLLPSGWLSNDPCVDIMELAIVRLIRREGWH
jgi:hypothetical protein